MGLTDKIRDNYKSGGEQEIAGLLSRYRIPFVFEKETLVKDGVKLKIRYPDFCLPESKVHIELFGMENDPSYRARTMHKLKVYAQNHLDLVPVYPRHLGKRLEPYLMGRIRNLLDRRLKEFQMRLVRGHSCAPLPYIGRGYED